MKSALSRGSQVVSMRRLRVGIGVVGWLLLGAFFAFELFNYSTTKYALTDILGAAALFGLRWDTLLSLLFCTIDLGAFVRFVRPERPGEDPSAVHYLFAGWLLAAAFNAVLTWWGVSLAMVASNPQLGLITWISVFISACVFLVRLFLMATLVVGGERVVMPARTSKS
jgi:hypothetical protein